MMKLMLVLLFLSQYFRAPVGQIPGPCVEDGTITSSTCCPVPVHISNSAGACGENLPTPRGKCVPISAIVEGLTISSGPQDDTRQNWPYYFQNLCKCNGNYGGYDCGECIYGKTGDSCENSTIITRKEVGSLTAQERDAFLAALKMAKTSLNYTRFMAIKNETLPPVILQLSLYDLFAWMHYYTGRENDLLRRPELNCTIRDYAHESGGFLPWHRRFLRWFERELQILAGNDNLFLPYWDWTNSSHREILFSDNWFGSSSSGVVSGDFGNWDTLCWHYNVTLDCTNYKQLCDPTVPTGKLRRCPVDSECKSDGPNWPTQQDVNDAVSISNYDSAPYSYSSQGFRSLVEGFINNSCSPATDTLCTKDGISRKLHNTLHLILGMGSLNESMSIVPGAMANVPAAANDPMFIVHHAMIDYIFELWLQTNKNSSYVPNNNASDTLRGHRAGDVMVPFIPLYTCIQFFKTAQEFGYQYASGIVPPPVTAPTKQKIGVNDIAVAATAGPIGVLVLIISTTTVGCWCYRRRQQTRAAQRLLPAQAHHEPKRTEKEMLLSYENLMNNDMNTA